MRIIKNAVGVTILALAAVCLAQGQDATGDWQGALNTGAGELRIVLHITKGADGTLKATLDSPDQGIVGMPVDSIQIDGNKLSFAVNVVKGSYEGTVKGSSISGNWAQPRKMPLEFKKSTTPIKLEHAAAPPSDIDGEWDGVVDVPSIAKEHLSFHIKNSADGLVGSFDDPDMSVKGYPIVAIIRKGSSIKIEVPQVGGEVVGKLNKDLSVVSGDWNQTDHNYPLTLKRLKEAAAAKP